MPEEKKERPMLFNGAMVRAILADQKTVTRRLVPEWQLPSKTSDDERWISVAQRHPRWGFGVFGETEKECMANYSSGYSTCCPFGSTGDRLWVRETWQLHEKFTDNCVVVYKANERNSWTEFHRRYPVQVARGVTAKPFQTNGFRPSIHMPRWACRLLLEIAAVRVERLQDISEEQAIAEGVSAESVEAYRRAGVDRPAGFAFRDLWQSVYGEESWVSNPWVWAVEFKRVTP